MPLEDEGYTGNVRRGVCWRCVSSSKGSVSERHRSSPQRRPPQLVCSPSIRGPRRFGTNTPTANRGGSRGDGRAGGAEGGDGGGCLAGAGGSRSVIGFGADLEEFTTVGKEKKRPQASPTPVDSMSHNRAHETM